MEIKVLGSCCGNCDKLMALVQEVVSDRGHAATVQKVTDMKEIVGYGVMRTPGLVVDGKVVAAGRVPSKVEIEGWLAV
jgi:small redox-active disulfide protein 2